MTRYVSTITYLKYVPQSAAPAPAGPATYVQIRTFNTYFSLRAALLFTLSLDKFMAQVVTDQTSGHIHWQLFAFGISANGYAPAKPVVHLILTGFTGVRIIIIKCSAKSPIFLPYLLYPSKCYILI